MSLFQIIILIDADRVNPAGYTQRLGSFKMSSKKRKSCVEVIMYPELTPIASDWKFSVVRMFESHW